MATYSGVAAPASPASTSTMSPGVSWRTRKLTTMMTRIVGTAWTRRRATNRATPGRASIIRTPAGPPGYGWRYVSRKLPYGPSAPMVWFTSLLL